MLLARPAFLDEFLSAPMPVSSAPVEGEGRKSDVSSHQQRGSTCLNSALAELIASDVAQARSTTSLTSGSPTRSILGCETLATPTQENEGSLLRKSLRPLEDHPIKRFIRESTNGTNSCETRGGGEKGGALFGEKSSALFGSSLRPSNTNRPNTGDAPTAKEDIRPEISYSSLLEERREQNLAAANAKTGALSPNSRNSLFDKHKQTISEGALETDSGVKGRRIWGNSCADKGTLSPIGPYVAEFFAKTPPHCGSGRRSATSRPSTFGLLEQSQQHRFEARPRRRSMGSETRAVAVAGQLQQAEAYLLEIEAKLELSGAEAAAQAQDVAEKLARIAEARERLGQRDNVSKDLAAFREGKRQQLDRADRKSVV